MRALALLGAASGCYATVGPTVGITTKGEPTLGFEGGGTSFSFGKSYVFPKQRRDPQGGAPGNAKVRTFWAWEPGYPFASQTDRRIVWGAPGVSVGQVWEADGEKRWFGGAWTGAGYSPSSSEGSCVEDLRPYGMLVLGYRADGFYLAPKVGLMILPQLCINLKF